MEIIQGKIRWIKALKPSNKELEELKAEFNLHPVVVHEIQEESMRGHVENFGNYLYLVYQFPVYDQQEMVSRREEIDFIITKNEVITVSYRENAALGRFENALADSGFKEKALNDTFQFTYQLLLHLLNFSQRQLLHINEKAEEVADELFRGREKELLKKISYLKRDISEYRLIVRPQENILKSLPQTGAEFWGEQSKAYFEDLFGEYLKLFNQLESHRETINDFSETNNHLLNVKTNEVMKTFTILAFATFPLTLIVSLFAIRAPGTPLIDSENGFWVISGMVAAVVLLMLAYFKKKNWL